MFMGSELWIDLKRPAKNGRLIELSTEADTTEMLDASNQEAVDQVVFFLGALVKKCCGTDETAHIQYW